MAQPAASSPSDHDFEVSVHEARTRFVQLVRVASLTGRSVTITDQGRALATIVPAAPSRQRTGIGRPPDDPAPARVSVLREGSGAADGSGHRDDPAPARVSVLREGSGAADGSGHRDDPAPARVSVLREGSGAADGSGHRDGPNPADVTGHRDRFGGAGHRDEGRHLSQRPRRPDTATGRHQPERPPQLDTGNVRQRVDAETRAEAERKAGAESESRHAEAFRQA
ncbi:hypothetical protein ACFOS3_49275, partial [Paractinoplanes deccanensis]